MSYEAERLAMFETEMDALRIRYQELAGHARCAAAYFEQERSNSPLLMRLAKDIRSLQDLPPSAIYA